jgi:drug/metabolite transporter (DMT)-like permease
VRQSNPALFGALCALTGVFLFSVNDVLIKGLSGSYALHQIIFLRSLAGLCFLLGVILPFAGGLGAFRVRRPWVLVLRGVFVLISNTCYYLALPVMTLSEVVAVFFLAPVLITILSAVILREAVGWLRWGACLAGFLGVMLIVRPGGEAFQPWALMVVGSAAAYGAMQLLTRRYGAEESGVMLILSLQMSFLLFSGLIGLAFGDGHLAQTAGNPVTAFFFRAWAWPPLSDLWIFALMGVGSTGGGFLMAQAYRAAPAALVAGFEYAGLPYALFWGAVIFAQWPGAWSLAGMALILAGGLALVVQAARGGGPVSRTAETRD